MHPDQSPLFKLLPIIRVAMIFTVLIAGGLVWYLFGGNGNVVEGMPLEADARQYINIFFLALIGVVALVVMFVRRKLEEDLAKQQKFAFVLAGWAAAEGIALLGAVFNMWGDTTFFIAGLMILLMTFMVVPIPKGDSDKAL